MAPMDLYGSNVDLPLLYGTHMGSMGIKGEQLYHYLNKILKKNSTFSDINANNNDNKKIK